MPGAQTDGQATVLSEQERADLLFALRVPRGRYSASRAAQLSGVPERTVHHWAVSGVLVPDFPSERPKAWSYRDLVYLRLVVFLRSHQVGVNQACELASRLREEFMRQDPDLSPVVSALGT